MAEQFLETRPQHRTIARVATAGVFLLGMTWMRPNLPAQSSKESASPAQAPASGDHAAAASEASPPPPGTVEKSRKTFPVRTGSVTYSRVEESERLVTPDGDVVTERALMPRYAGDRGLLHEREIRTRKLPDGTVEKEYVLKNPDGSNRLVPTEIIRERITKLGDQTTVERETLKPDFEGHWKPLRRETVTETATETTKQIVKEVREPALGHSRDSYLKRQGLRGDWEVVDREVTQEKSSEGSKEIRSVRQLPDAYGRLSDYEVRKERTTAGEGKEDREVSVERRDFQDTDHPKFYVVERTRTEQRTAPDGSITTKSVKESDLLGDGAARNLEPGGPRVVEERMERDTPGEAGAGRKVVSVKTRGVADPRLRPAHEVVQETDRQGNVRQIFIPSR